MSAMQIDDSSSSSAAAASASSAHAGVAASPSPSPIPPSAASSGASALNFLPVVPPPAPQNVRVVDGRVMEKVDKPFMYGSAAFWQGKQPENVHSHRWTVYLRALEHEDLSYFIEHVTFQLHHTIPEPTRVLYQAPYEVTETGWGEFEIKIIVTFKACSALEPITLTHGLKLFPPAGTPPSTKKPVMSEVYDEFVFVHPTVEWYNMLHSGPVRRLEHHPLMPFVATKELANQEDYHLNKLQHALAIVQQKMDEERIKLFVVDKEITKLTENIDR